MRKIIVFLMLIILFGCKSSEIEYKKNDFSFYLPVDWQEKLSAWGDYYSDFESVIMVFEQKKNFEETVKTGFNFYKPSEFRLNHIWKINFLENEFVINTESDTYKLIKGRLVDGKIVAITSTNEEKIDEIYKKVFRK